MDPYEVGGPLPHTSCDHFTHAPRRCEKFIVHTLRVSGKGKAGAQAGLTFCLEKAEKGGFMVVMGCGWATVSQTQTVACMV